MTCAAAVIGASISWRSANTSCRRRAAAGTNADPSPIMRLCDTTSSKLASWTPLASPGVAQAGAIVLRITGTHHRRLQQCQVVLQPVVGGESCLDPAGKEQIDIADVLHDVHRRSHGRATRSCNLDTRARARCC